MNTLIIERNTIKTVYSHFCTMKTNTLAAIALVLLQQGSAAIAAAGNQSAEAQSSTVIAAQEVDAAEAKTQPATLSPSSSPAARLQTAPTVTTTEPSNSLKGSDPLTVAQSGPARIRATKDETTGPAKNDLNSPSTRETTANSLAVPNSILATGSNLNSNELSQNAMQLGRQLGVLNDIGRLPGLRGRVSTGSDEERVNLLQTRKSISIALRQAEMDVNFVLAEIFDEQSIYTELIGTYTSDRDKLIAKTNMISWSTNGILWAVCEGLTIPTYRISRYAESSGITGILAGIVPSIASAYTLKEVVGRKYSAPAAPNLLCKVFDRPLTIQTDYPDSVWQFLDSVPADGTQKKRKDVIIDRWIADSNIPAFTNRNSDQQIDSVCAVKDQKKTVTIGLLSARISMPAQLSSEIFKMNRLLNELEMALRGAKHV